jgi:hypothetical protein
MHVCIVLLYFKLFKNEKENAGCWCEPLINKLAVYPRAQVHVFQSV